MDWLDSVFDLDGWGDAIASFYDDSGLDTLVAGVGNLFSDGSLTDGLGDIFGSIGNTLSGAVNFTLDGLFGSSGAMGVGGIDDSSNDLGKSLASQTGEPASKGLIGGVVDWTKANPDAAKLTAGLISGAAQGYMQNKALDQQQKQFDARIAAEQKALRDRYDYEVDAKKKDRTAMAQEYMNAYGAK